ncbi:MAG: GxxExxY protein [Verrucomicrobia bacterium]|nr:GxxExxY protein [Verrucomicrobiota bacterium]
MHSLFQKADTWSRVVIAAAIEVHRTMGPGLLEEVYEKCLLREMLLRNVPVENQIRVPILYKGFEFEQPMRLDLFVDNCLIVELKAVEHVIPIHRAQLLSYMKLMNVPLGLLLNFHEMTLKAGISRLILPGANDLLD